MVETIFLDLHGVIVDSERLGIGLGTYWPRSAVSDADAAALMLERKSRRQSPARWKHTLINRAAKG
jgi:hypothetical protein